MSDSRPCPYCAENIKRNARLCRHCQKEVTPLFVDDPSANKQINSIVDWARSGESIDGIEERLKTNSYLRLDTGEHWTKEQIQSVIEQFTKSSKSSKPRNPPKGTSATTHVVGMSIAILVGALVLVGMLNEPKSVDTGVFTKEQVCRGTIAALFGHPPKIISMYQKQGEVMYFTYLRPDDQTRWNNRCKIEGNTIIWASETGRWRTHQLDEVITFSVDYRRLNILQIFSDGSKAEKTYTPTDFEYR